MSLTNVWVQTRGDGVVRADQVVGIDAHQTPVLTGKPARWLLDVVLPTTIGSGARDGWGVTALHRTLTQTTEDPAGAPAALARLLAQLDHVNAAGIIAVSTDSTPDSPLGGEELSTRVRFRFVPFTSPDPGHYTGAEYL
ncbi:MAG TPA: hypothetical protein VGM75_30660 [Pseudonocardiaceae bacterium]|jgi:hypothetical protein